MGIRVGLIGNPNSGKTTLFNALTGSHQFVGNWPGVTIEKKSGNYKSQDFQCEVVDLPGIYSLSTISLEEEVTTNFIKNQEMDCIINIVDASNLERNLFLTLQLLDTHIPMVVALNCMDIVEKQLANINTVKLEQALGVKIVPITASKKMGILELMRQVEVLHHIKRITHPMYSEPVEAVISTFQTILDSRFIATRYFEDGEKALSQFAVSPQQKKELAEIKQKAQATFALDFDMVLVDARYTLIESIRKEVLFKPEVSVVSTTEKIDRVLTHRIFGLPLFALIMLAVFYFAFGPLGSWITDGFVYLIEAFFAWIASGVEALGMAEWVSSLINNGFFGGLASVVSFLPQLAILFLFLSLLEDSGYMSRAAFIMDRVLRRFGLSGKSFIPMLLGFGCSVPAMVATRTLDKAEDRKLTTMIIPFMSCGAKAPIYGLFAGALFARGSFLVVFSLYVLGILIALLSAVLFKKTILRNASANYLMELPEYRVPTVKNTLIHTWEKSKGFLIKAGTILLGAFIVIWFFSYFGFVEGGFRLLAEEEIEFSILGQIGKWIQPLLQPIGVLDWRPAVAILTGFVAKESVVGTLGILYGVSGDVIENGQALFPQIQAMFTPVQAYAYMAFALLSAPCIAALAAMKKELLSMKWFLFAFSYEMIVAYGVAFAIYQLGTMSSGGLLTIAFLAIIIGIVITTGIRVFKNKGSTCTTCSGCIVDQSCTRAEKEVQDRKNGTSS